MAAVDNVTIRRGSTAVTYMLILPSVLLLLLSTLYLNTTYR